MQTIYLVISNSGDGSSSIQVIKRAATLALLTKMADEGDEEYASGDGLLVTEVKFPDEFAVDAWVKMNFHDYSDEDIWENRDASI